MTLIDDLLKEQRWPESNGDTEVSSWLRGSHRGLLSEEMGEAIVKRMRQGEDAYNGRLYAHNGRDALADAFQEAMDAVFYCGQAIIEERWWGPGALEKSLALAQFFIDAAKTDRAVEAPVPNAPAAVQLTEPRIALPEVVSAPLDDVILDEPVVP